MRYRFSTRLDWSHGENPLAASEAAVRLQSGAILDLTESNPTVVHLAAGGSYEALGEVLGRASAAVYRPHPCGDPNARAAIAAALTTTGSAVDPERLVLTTGSSESYSFLCKLLADPGDTLLVPEPSYPLFEYLARLEGLRIQPYRLTHDGTASGTWSLDFHSLDEALSTAATRIAAIIVVSPHNPTGAILRAADLAGLDRRAAAAGIAILADEVFSDYVERPTSTDVRCVAAQQTEALTFSLGGLSKSCGLPQLKLGWIAAGGPTALVKDALQRLELIADTYLSVGTPVQAALPAILALGAVIRGSITSRILQNRAFLARAIGKSSPLTLLASDGGWSAILRVPSVRTDEEWAITLLQQDGVLCQPGYFFDLSGATFLVLGLLAPPHVFQEGVRRLVARIGGAATPPQGA